MKQWIAGLILAGVAMGASAGDPTEVTIFENGQPVLVLTLPAGSAAHPYGNKTTIVTPDMYLHIWDIKDDGSIAETVLHVGEIIEGDVLDFNAIKTTEITVAGKPAVELYGSGKEADDGDDSAADIVVFEVNGRIFVACVHGEGSDASKEKQPMLNALKTARPPGA